MNGVIVIDKPAGPTSHDVVAVVRRAIGLTRIGHTGTLDPLATGVLPLVIGSATRLASFMSGADKEYVARIRIGAATETYDAETAGSRAQGRGGIPELAAVSALTEAVVAQAVATFAGRYLQTPPPYSAKKVGGTPAYKLARQGKPVDVKPVEVTVTEIELRSYADGMAEVRLVCSSGFYVRSLAHDLGQRLGCGAHLEGLQRTRAGAFRLEEAVPVGDLVTGGPAVARRTLIPMSGLLTHLSCGRPHRDGRRAGAPRRSVEAPGRHAADRAVRTRRGWPGEASGRRWIARRAGRRETRRAFASRRRFGVRC